MTFLSLHFIYHSNPFIPASHHRILFSFTLMVHWSFDWVMPYNTPRLVVGMNMCAYSNDTWHVLLIWVHIIWWSVSVFTRVANYDDRCNSHFQWLLMHIIIVREVLSPDYYYICIYPYDGIHSSVLLYHYSHLLFLCMRISLSNDMVWDTYHSFLSSVHWPDRLLLVGVPLFVWWINEWFFL